MTERRRLRREDRRNALIDAAAELIVENGVAALTFERVAAAAQVSTALVYAYFPNRRVLLSALLLREYPVFEKPETLHVDLERTIEDVVRDTTFALLASVEEKGPLLQRLLGEPSVARVVAEEHERGRALTIAHFVAQLRREAEVDEETASAAVDMLMGITRAAATMIAEGRYRSDELAPLVVRIIMSALQALGTTQVASARSMRRSVKA